MKAAGRSTMRATNPNQQGNTFRRPTMDATAMRGVGPSASARLTAPLSSHSTAVRKRQSVASALGGAGDGDASVAAAWKTTGRRLGGLEKRQTSITPRLEQPTIASSLRAASNRQTLKQQRERAAAAVAASMSKPVKVATRGKGGAAMGGAASSVGAAKKERLWNQPSTKQATRARLWAPKKLGGNAASPGGTTAKKDKRSTVFNEVKTLSNSERGVVNEHAAGPFVEQILNVAIQTNEAEILDNSLLSGNIKIMKPSPDLAFQIDKTRREAKAKAERQSIRRFNPHEQDEELHLDELKEFMERNAVTKRAPKKPPPITYGTYDHQFSNVFKSMDDFFRSEVPKSESITDIKERIKRKEVELMSLFDNVDNMANKSDFEFEV